MAAQQEKNQVNGKQFIEPRSFAYTSGQWRLPTPENKTAELISGTKVDASAEGDINPLVKNTVEIVFYLTKPQDNSGWDAANLSVWAKVGENGKVSQVSINKEYLEAVTDNIRSFTVTMIFEKNVSAPDNKLHFGLTDSTEQEKRGLILQLAAVGAKETA